MLVAFLYAKKKWSADANARIEIVNTTMNWAWMLVRGNIGTTSSTSNERAIHKNTFHPNGTLHPHYHAMSFNATTLLPIAAASTT